MRDDIAYRIPEHLDENIGQDERLPLVGLRGSFTRLIKRSLDNKDWHDLEDQVDDREQKLKESEHLVLQALLSVVCIEE